MSLWTFFMLNWIKHEIYLLINVKMPKIVGILTFISRFNTTSDLFKQEKKTLKIIVFTSGWNLMLSWSYAMYLYIMLWEFTE